MLKVRFLEDCYFLDTRVNYSYDEIATIDKSRAERLYKNGTVDILKDDEFVEKKEDVTENPKQEDDLDTKKVTELRDMAQELGIDGYTTMKKQELIENIKQVI